MEEHNGVYASTAGDTSGGKGGRGYVSTTFQPGRTTTTTPKKKKKKEKKAEEQEGGGGREEGQQEQQKQPVVATKRGTTLGNRGVVLKSFAEARLIFKLLAPPDSGESQEERNGKEMKRKGQRGTEGGEGTF